MSFPVPLTATFAGRLVRLLDLSSRGARIEHHFPLMLSRRRLLEFTCEGERLAIECEVVRSRFESDAGRPVYRTGLRFAEETDTLWGLMTALAIAQLKPSATEA